MLSGKKIMVATGGTAGHINPALAVMGYIRENYDNVSFMFVGTAERMEARLVPEAGFPFRTIDIQGFSRDITPAGIKKNVATVVKLAKSSSQAKKIIDDFRPDAVLGFGGYASAPILREAAKRGIPTAIHEQNAFPGVTNKALAKKVDAVMLTAGRAAGYLHPKNPCVVTGLPVRNELLRADRTKSRKELGIPDNVPLILSMGGSLGAKVINDAVLELIEKYRGTGKCCFMHATGKNGASVIDELNNKGIKTDGSEGVYIREYIDDMDRCMSAADLVICRAGASSLSELQAMGKPSVLVPYPYAAENHQYYNALELKEKNAAVLIEEKEFTGERLKKEVEILLENPSTMIEMGKNAYGMAITDATERIIKCICSIIS